MLSQQTTNITQGARALGWASVGIGLAELAAPHKVEEVLGLDHREQHHGILRVLGIRELMHGIGILTEQRPSRQLAVGVWSRVAGDALDSALLAVAATKTKRPNSFMTVAAAVSVIGALDVYYAVKTSHHRNACP